MPENLSSVGTINNGAEQPGHPCSLISAIAIHLLEGIISTFVKSENFLASLCSCKV